MPANERRVCAPRITLDIFAFIVNGRTISAVRSLLSTWDIPKRECGRRPSEEPASYERDTNWLDLRSRECLFCATGVAPRCHRARAVGTATGAARIRGLIARGALAELRVRRAVVLRVDAAAYDVRVGPRLERIRHGCAPLPRAPVAEVAVSLGDRAGEPTPSTAVPTTETFAFLLTRRHASLCRSTIRRESTRRALA